RTHRDDRDSLHAQVGEEVERAPKQGLTGGIHQLVGQKRTDTHTNGAAIAPATEVDGQAERHTIVAAWAAPRAVGTNGFDPAIDDPNTREARGGEALQGVTGHSKDITDSGKPIDGGAEPRLVGGGERPIERVGVVATAVPPQPLRLFGRLLDLGVKTEDPLLQ